MTETERLSGMIQSCFEHHQREIAEGQQAIDSTMSELLRQRERFTTVANRILESVIRLRMDELARHFTNATVTEGRGDTVFHCLCRFSHIPRFPATVSFGISLLPEEKPTELTARYDLSILPTLMEYQRDEERKFSFDGSDEAIGKWVEEKIVHFIDTYLRLETHPLYQKDNIVLDPVCGMQISAITATSKIEMPGRTIYFCSEACKEAFPKEKR